MKTLMLDYNTADHEAPHLLLTDDGPVGRIRKESDALSIRRAVNNHENLVRLLQDISGTLQAADPMKERILDTLTRATA